MNDIPEIFGLPLHLLAAIGLFVLLIIGTIINYKKFKMPDKCQDKFCVGVFGQFKPKPDCFDLYRKPKKVKEDER